MRTYLSHLISDGYTVFPADAVSAAAVCVSKDKSRPALMGIKLYNEGSHAVCAATDTYRLVEITTTMPDDMKRVELLVNADDLKPYLVKGGLLAIKQNDDKFDVIGLKPAHGNTYDVKAQGIVADTGHKFPVYGTLFDGYNVSPAPLVPAFNSAYLADVCKVAQLACGKGTAVETVGKGDQKDYEPLMFRSDNSHDAKAQYGIKVLQLLMCVHA